MTESSAHNAFELQRFVESRAQSLWSSLLPGLIARGRDISLSAILGIAIFALLIQASPAQGQTGGAATFTSFDVSSAGTGSRQGTAVMSINAAGDLLGVYTDANSALHGYVRAANGTISTISVPGASTYKYHGTIPVAMNAAGVVAGVYRDTSEVMHGFVRTANGVISTFDPPVTYSKDINVVGVDAAGDVVGFFKDGYQVSHGFMRAASGAFTVFDAVATGNAYGDPGTIPICVDAAGDVAGVYTDLNQAEHGFIRSAAGTISTFDAPGAGSGSGQGTTSLAIDASGDLAGIYLDSKSAAHGFVRTANGTMHTFDATGAGSGKNQGTFPVAIDTAGNIAGIYIDAEGVAHSFVRGSGGAMTSFSAPGANTSAAMVKGLLARLKHTASEANSTSWTNIASILEGTAAVSIDATYGIAGTFFDADKTAHGFVRATGGAITTFDAPLAGTGAYQGTAGFAVNGAGTIAGTWADANSVLHGFLYTPAQATTITILTAAPANASFGEPVTLTATVSATGSAPPNGESVWFMDGATQLGSGVLSGGTATLTTTGLPTGNLALTAVYGGDKNFSGSTSAAVIEAVATASTSVALSASSNPSNQGELVTFTVTVSGQFGGTPSGSVSFNNGNASLGTATLSGGSATFATSALAQGTYSIAAVYSGDANFAGNTSNTVNQVVNAAANAMGQWTWMDGNNAPPCAGYECTQQGVYGVLGVAAPGNTPGGRQSAANWIDKSGNLWLFGGEIWDAQKNQDLINDLWQFSPSTYEWTWMGGGSLNNMIKTTAAYLPGVYGTLGTAAAGNIPGTRENATQWTDGNGNLWLFGGLGIDSNGNIGNLNDLWEFNPVTKLWAWMGGSNVAHSYGQPGVYGTLGTPAAGNTPGGRINANSWTDNNGNLWLFGGNGVDANGAIEYYLNDFWKFNPATSQWTWMGGSKIAGVNSALPGVYGTLSKPAAGNYPGGRSDAVTWTDRADHLWLFGGMGCDANGANGALNDLWSFNLATGQWTWVSGSNTLNNAAGNPSDGQPGIYGTLGAAAAGNVPGGRLDAVSWIDAAGHLWLFGGNGEDSTGPPDGMGYLDDLWEFNPATNLWTWMAGSSTNAGSKVGAYGTLRVPAVGNNPGGRNLGNSWVDSKGNFWLFGGYGFDSNGNGALLNDLWSYQPPAVTLQSVATPVLSVPSGAYTTAQTVSITDATSGATIFYTTDGSMPTPASYVYTQPIAVNATMTLTAIAIADGYSDSGFAAAHYAMNLVGAALSFTASPRAVAFDWSVTLTATLSAPSNVTLIMPQFWVYDGTTALVSGALSNISSGSTSGYMGTIATLSPGTHTLTAFAVATLESPLSITAPNGVTVASLPVVVNVALPLVATPVFTLPEGAYAGAQTVSITDATPGASIHCTTDGSTPTANSAVCSGPISISSSETIEAIATASGYTSSSLATAGYVITPQAANGVLQWTWMGGSNTTGSTGEFGILGTPATGNAPSSRENALTWTDSSGNTWLYGGDGMDSADQYNLLNDLWQFNPVTNQWTWVSGSSTGGQAVVYGTLGTPAAGNSPGGRTNAVGWADANGNLWLFGGVVNGASNMSMFMNDLWKFTPSLGQWTWMGGNKTSGSYGVNGSLGTLAAGNIPSGRNSAMGWTDKSDNFWLFGGWGADNLNDLWEYSPTTNLWAWMGGDNVSSCAASGSCVLPPVYGTQGTPAAANIPGGRYASATWTDANGNLWLFGGFGYFAGTSDDDAYLNDLWEFNIATRQWTWITGSNIPVNYGGNPGTYGTMGTSAPGNTPGARFYASPWTDLSGHLWLFGGAGMDGNGNSGNLSDLWEFDPSINQWTWMDGSSTANSSGAYGTLGIPAAGTLPTSRNSATSWTDSKGNLWLFSGQGQNASSVNGYFNDLWKYEPPSPPAAAPVISPAQGTFTSAQTVSITDATANATIYYTTDGSTPTTGSSVYNVPITVSSTETVEAIATASGYTNSAVTKAAYTITPPAAAPVISPAQGTFTSAQTVSITDATANATIYYTTDGSTPTTSSSVYNVPITVSSTETVEAIATASGYTNSAVTKAAYTISLPANPFPVIGGISPAFISAGGPNLTLTINGTGFSANSTVYWGTSALSTQYASATQLSAVVPAAQTSTVGTVSITVETPLPGGGNSNAWQFEVNSTASGTAPTIPTTTASVAAGSTASYGISVPSAVSSITASCLNLPAGATCSYSSTSNTLTISTSSSTPSGTYQVTVVFNSTETAAAAMLLPIFLLPLAFLRKRITGRGVWITACMGVALLVAAACASGCGGGGGSSSIVTTPPSQQVTSSATVSLTVK